MACKRQAQAGTDPMRSRPLRLPFAQSPAAWPSSRHSASDGPVVRRLFVCGVSRPLRSPRDLHAQALAGLRRRGCGAAARHAGCALRAGLAGPVHHDGRMYLPGVGRGQHLSGRHEVTYSGRLYEAMVTHTAYPGAGWNPAATPVAVAGPRRL